MTKEYYQRIELDLDELREQDKKRRKKNRWFYGSLTVGAMVLVMGVNLFGDYMDSRRSNSASRGDVENYNICLSNEEFGSPPTRGDYDCRVVIDRNGKSITPKRVSPP